jgi:lysozyme
MRTRAWVLRGFAAVSMASSTLLACGAASPESIESSSAAVTVCGQNTVQGMDVSHYDGTIDWATAKAHGIDFAFVKATESTTYVDPTFAANWAGMKAAGVVRGAYHFFRANTDPLVQASHVAQTVGALEANDLPIVLDLETADGETGATIGANAVKFLDAVTAATGKTAIVYTSPGFITGTVGTPPAGLGKYTLWVANWGVTCPDVVAPWSNWTFWQHSATGTVAGVPSTAVDLDTFNGTLAELTGLGGSDAGTIAHGDGGTSQDAGSGGHDAAVGGDASMPAADSGPIAQGGGSGGGGGAPGLDAGGVHPTTDGGHVPGAFAPGSGGGCSVGRGGSSLVTGAMLGAIALAATRRRRRRP